MINKIKDYEKEHCDISIYAFDNEKILFSYNENHIQDGACTLKVFIMIEYVRQVIEGKICGSELAEVTEENVAMGAGTIKFLSYGMKVQISDLVELMVSISDHMAANMLIDYLGIDNINRTITEFGFSNTRLLKKYIVPRNKHVAETTAYEYARFYSMLDNNEFFDKKGCSYMKKILRNQKYKDFLAEPLAKYNEYIDMASKSGKVDGRTEQKIANSCVNDGGICITKSNRYYVAFLSEIHHDSCISMFEMKELMHEVSEYIFEENIKKCN